MGRVFIIGADGVWTDEYMRTKSSIRWKIDETLEIAVLSNVGIPFYDCTGTNGDMFADNGLFPYHDIVA